MSLLVLLVKNVNSFPLLVNVSDNSTLPRRTFVIYGKAGTTVSNLLLNISENVDFNFVYPKSFSSLNQKLNKPP